MFIDLRLIKSGSRLKAHMEKISSKTFPVVRILFYNLPLCALSAMRYASSFHHIRQKKRDLRKGNQKNDLNGIRHQMGYDTPEYGPDRNA